MGLVNRRLQTESATLEDDDAGADSKTKAENQLQQMHAKKEPGTPATRTYEQYLIGKLDDDDPTVASDAGKKLKDLKAKEWQVYGPKSNESKPATQNQFRMVEKTKQDRLSAIDKETDARIKKEATDELGTYDDAKAQQIYADASDKKNQVQQAYLNEIQALKPDFDPSQAPQTIATAAPAHPAARAGVAAIPAPGLPGTPNLFSAHPAVRAAAGAPQTTTPPVPAATITQPQAVPTQSPAASHSRQGAPPPVTFHKENLPDYVKQNNAARQAKGLPPLTIDQTKRALELQNFQVH